MKIERKHNFEMTVQESFQFVSKPAGLMNEFEDVVDQYTSDHIEPCGLVEKLIEVAAIVIDIGAQTAELHLDEFASGLNEAGEKLLDLVKDLIGWEAGD
jgi:hypothetical protein